METIQALTQYYEGYDEDHCLCSRWGIVKCSGCSSGIISPPVNGRT